MAYSSVAIGPFAVAPFGPSAGAGVLIALGFNKGCWARSLYPCTGSPFRCWTFLSCCSITWTESSTWCSPDFELPQPILALELFLWMEWNLASSIPLQRHNFHVQLCVSIDFDFADATKWILWSGETKWKPMKWKRESTKERSHEMLKIALLEPFAE